MTDALRPPQKPSDTRSMPKDAYFAESADEAKKIVKEKSLTYPVLVIPDENSPYDVVNNEDVLEKAVGDLLGSMSHKGRVQILRGPTGLASGRYPSERNTVK